MTNEQIAVGPARELAVDPEMPAVQEQLIVFARELGELYRM